MNIQIFLITCMVYCVHAAHKEISIIEVVKKIPEQEEHKKSLQYTSSITHHYSIKEISEHMMWISAHDVRTFFTKLPVRAKLVLLEYMDIKTYTSFLTAFTHEQWQEMLHTMPEHEQSLIPNSYIEQLRMIRDTWYEYAPKRFYETIDNQVRDILKWRIRALQRAMQGPNSENQRSLKRHLKRFYKQINNIFEDKKLALLKSLSVPIKKGNHI